MVDTDMKSVKIPKKTYKRIKGRIKDTGFTSVSEYVGYVLTEVLDNLEEEGQEETFSEEEEEKVKERLRALGYLD